MMNQQETIAVLHSKIEQLMQENDELKTMMSVMKENRDLRAKMQGYSTDNVEACSVCSTLAVGNPPCQSQNTCDEEAFRNSLQQPSAEHERRTSSPIKCRSFTESSMSDTSLVQSLLVETSSVDKGPQRILGEIAYQLDRRIVTHVFRGHRRVYGFTVRNIADRIIEASTHPLTGEVDQGYRLHLTQRHNELMESLIQLGYNSTLHPTLVEFIINTYGLRRKRDLKCPEMSDPDFLRQLVTTTAPPQLQKDLLILLTCLCYMAKKDKRPIYLF